MSAEEMQEMLRIVCALLARPESEPFRRPVDWRALQLLDYPSIVKRPSDLGTVKDRLERDQYETVEEAAADVRLIWTNCMSYNQDGSEFYFLADTFARKFEEAYANIRGEDVAARDVNRIPSMDERMQLSYDIFKLDNVKLGRVLTIIEGACPAALNKRASEDEVLVNFDAMTPACFNEVGAFVQSCVSGGGKGKKKRAADGAGTAVAPSVKRKPRA